MFTHVFMLLFFGLAIEARGSENIIPLAMIDDAKAKLEELRQTVVGAIFVAEDDLDNLQTDFATGSGNTQITAQVRIQEEEQKVMSQMNNIKDLANLAAVDISYCLRGREEFLQNLLPAIVAELLSCINVELNEGSKIVNSTKYLVDISINRVDAINFQLNLCDSDSDGCITPLLQQIELETEELPQGIKVEVLRASDLFDNLEVSVTECSDVKIAQYVYSASTILRDLTQCVDNLLG